MVIVGDHLEKVDHGDVPRDDDVVGAVRDHLVVDDELITLAVEAVTHLGAALGDEQ